MPTIGLIFNLSRAIHAESVTASGPCVDEFIRYQSRMIECVDAVTIEEAREIIEGLDTDQDRAENARPRRASRARKRPHRDDFLYYDD